MGIGLAEQIQTTMLVLTESDKIFSIFSKYCQGSMLKALRLTESSEIKKQLKVNHPVILLLDIKLEDNHGLQLLTELLKENNELPVIMLSNRPSLESAAAAFRAGACDYLSYAQLLPQHIEQAIAACMKHQRDIQASRRYREHLESEVHAKTTILITQLSERRKVDRALRRSEQRLKSVIENATDIICTLSFEGKILSLNTAFNKLTGYKQSTWLRRPLIELLNAEDRDVIENQLQRAFSGFETTAEECRIRHKNRTERIGELTTSRLIENDDVVGVLVIIRDITEKKQAEVEKQQLQLQLLQAQKLESIGRLAGGVAHDFNNALTAILGFSELALGELALNHPVREYVDVIKDAGEKAATLTKQLLAFGRKQILKVEHVCINTVVLRMGRMLQRLIGDDALLHMTVDASLSIVLADPAQLEQIVMNLVINARDAMPHGGELWIMTENRQLSEEDLLQRNVAPGEYLILTVKDNGAGMTEEAKSRIFEPFYTTKAPGKGTGLGLATVFGVMSQHQGFITCDSALNQGSEFKAYLPVVTHQEMLSKPVRQGEERLRGGDETLLVVDDEPAIRRLLVSVLKKFGYRLLQASSGEEAIEMSEQTQIDMLLTDMVMPGINGLVLAAKLAETNPYLETLYMSGYAQQTVGSDYPESFRERFIQKPLKPYDVAQRIRELLDQQHALVSEPLFEAS